MTLPNQVSTLFSATTGKYTIGRSLRFRSSATAYLSRSAYSSASGLAFTMSFWMKLGTITPTSDIFTFVSTAGSAPQAGIGFSDTANGQLTFWQYVNPTGYVFRVTPTMLFRDPSAWYHVVVAYDSANATASNRIKIYVNGVLQTALTNSTYPSQNTVSYYANGALYPYLGAQNRNGSSALYAFDGYFAEVNFVDGQALTPSSFGAYDTNGVWQPSKYGGTYGTNGFYLPFSNTTSTTTLVQDSSGNGNNWTPNNISLTSGNTYDSMIDSPTNAAGTSYGVGNYPTLNPLIAGNSSYLINANLSVSGAAAGNFQIPTMQLPTTGKWYCEISTTSYGASTIAGWFGVSSITGSNFSGLLGRTVNAGAGFYQNDVYILNQNINVLGSVIGVAVDRGANTVTIYINNVAQSTVPTLATGIDLYFAYGTYTGCAGWINFGQQPFTYTPPTGFQALNTYNLPTPSIANGAQYMAATTYTGTGSTLNVVNNSNTIGTTFAPDFVWIKSRSQVASHGLFDTVRGEPYAILSSDSTAAESTGGSYISSYGGITSNGFQVNNNTSGNNNGSTYIGWQWKGGGTGVTNTSGSITSTVSANTTAGFSVVTYTAQSSGTGTIGHGLNVAPDLIINKPRTGSVGWTVYHSSLGNNAYLILNTTAAQVTGATTVWNSTSPTSSVFTQGSAFAGLGTMVAYCFAAVRGYSAMGSYTGNGSTDGPFIYTGFRARFILIKEISGTNAALNPWLIYDTVRSTYNVSLATLRPNTTGAESTSSGAAGNELDILSNGFKPRTTWDGTNESGGTYIYAAFAENPFQIARAR